MKNLPSFNLSNKPDSKILNIILHGGSSGIESPFIQKVFLALKEKEETVLAFNFPYLERGEENSSGPELSEELEALQKMMEYVGYKDYSKVRLFAKSLGGIVASFYLDKLPPEESGKFAIVVLGYVTGDVRLKSFNGSITVIQGQKDKFGDIQTVKNDLKEAKSKSINYIEIEGADHSYRVPETKEPLFEDKVIEIIRDIT